MARGAVGGVAAGFGCDASLCGQAAAAAALRRNSVGDEQLFGDQRPGAGAEDGERLAPAQAPGGVSTGGLSGAGSGVSADCRGSAVSWVSAGSWVFAGSGVARVSGVSSALFTSEVLCPVSTSRKIVFRGTCPCNRPQPGLGSSPREEILTDCLRRSSRVSRPGRRPVFLGSGQCTRRPRSSSHSNAPRLGGRSSPPIRAGGRVHWPLLAGWRRRSRPVSCRPW